MIVDVAHPAPLVHVPPRARKSRLAYVTERTPVEVATMSDGEMRRVHTLHVRPNQSFGLYEGHGILWQRLSHTRPADPEHPITPGEWTSWLAGDPVQPAVEVILRNALAMTPLCAYSRDARPVNESAYAYGHRGDGPAAGNLGRVERDGRATAAQAVAAFVSGDTAVTDGAVFLRYRPVALRGFDAEESPRFAPHATPSFMPVTYHPPVHVVTDAAETFGIEPSQVHVDDAFKRDLDVLGPYCEDDVDVPLLANWLPGHYARFARDLARFDRVPGTPAHESAAAEAARAEGLALLGDVGLLRGGEAVEALEWFMGVATGTAGRFLGISPGGRGDWPSVSRHLRRVLDRNAPASVPGDDDAMAGLGARP